MPGRAAGRRGGRRAARRTVRRQDALTPDPVAAPQPAPAAPAPAPAPAPVAPAAPAAAAEPAYVAELKKLAELRDQGIINADDIRMRKSTGGMRLIEKHLTITIAGFFIAELLGMGDLYGDWTIDIRVVTQVYSPHTAAIDFFNDLVFS